MQGFCEQELDRVTRVLYHMWLTPPRIITLCVIEHDAIGTVKEGHITIFNPFNESGRKLINEGIISLKRAVARQAMVHA